MALDVDLATWIIGNSEDEIDQGDARINSNGYEDMSPEYRRILKG